MTWFSLMSNCCCGESGPPTGLCSHCIDGMPRYWEVTVSGIANGADPESPVYCGSCDELNGTYHFDMEPTGSFNSGCAGFLSLPGICGGIYDLLGWGWRSPADDRVFRQWWLRFSSPNTSPFPDGGINSGEQDTPIDCTSYPGGSAFGGTTRCDFSGISITATPLPGPVGFRALSKPKKKRKPCGCGKKARPKQ